VPQAKSGGYDLVQLAQALAAAQVLRNVAIARLKKLCWLKIILQNLLRVQNDWLS